MCIAGIEKLDIKYDGTGITRHINNIYKREELEENSTCAKRRSMVWRRKQYLYSKE